MFRGSVKGTGYPFYSPVSPSLPLPCVTICHHVSTGLYCVMPLDLHTPVSARTFGKFEDFSDISGRNKLKLSLSTP